jgi:hypothetical protein
MAKRTTARAYVRLTLDVEIPLGEVTSLADAATKAEAFKTFDLIKKLGVKAPNAFNDFSHKLDGVFLDGE